MPRFSRSEILKYTNTYHVILRGINKQDIFYENQDRVKFLKKLSFVNKKFGCDILAYALMNNHVHFAIRDNKEELSSFMHVLCTSYAKYFNEKYDRVGHLFQNRFKSIGVNSDRYLLNLIRYIHKNPEKEGISRMEDYEWSSYKTYLGQNGIVNTKAVLEMFDTNLNKAIKKFIEFNKESERRYSDSEFEDEKMTDEEAIENIKRILGINNIQNIAKLNKELQKKYVLKISNLKGIYVEQMSRILGIDKQMIYRMRKRNN